MLLPSTSIAQQPSGIQLRDPGQFQPSQTLVEALERRGNLVLRGASLESALFTINELWKVNIVAGDVKGQVNGVFKDAPLKEILDTILLGNGYAYRLVGESIVVSPLEKMGSVNPFFVSEAIPVKNVQPSELVSAASLLNTPQGKVQAVDSARSLIVVDFPERVKMIRELAMSIDAASNTAPGAYDASGNLKPVDVGYFHTQYISAEDAKLALATIMSPAGRVEALAGEDRLVIVDYDSNLQMARKVLEQIDRPRPQVQITALIYDLSLEDVEQIGINWSHALKDRHNSDGDPQSSFSANSVVMAPFGANDTGGTFTFMNLSTTFDVTAIVQAIQNAADSRLLANPNVTVMDNEKANFQAITQIPYQQIVQTDAGGQLAGTSFKDAGIKLDVTPKISADGTIELIVTPEFSRLTGFSPGDNQPIIDTRSTSTQVRVANGETIVIGGMRQRSDVGDFSGVPGAKDVRWLGHLFRSRSTNIRESELVVFITTRIVGYSEPLDCRNRLVADTIDCRLGNIPAAEGCPPGQCAPCGRGEAIRQLPVPAPIPGTMEIGPRELPPPEPVLPSPATTYRPAATTPGVSNPAYAGLEIRRLPPVDDETDEESDPTWRLRRDYDSRFQATGGVHAGDQRQVERNPEPQPTSSSAAETARKPSFWSRLWSR